MGCCGEREKGPPERKQRWQYIELNDFKCNSFWTYPAYGWLWFLGFVGVAVYGVDTFTAINLLVFDQWSSQVEPKIPFKYSKWIFSACIFLSWALLLYEWIRAIRVIKKDGVAASYMDPIAASLQSMRARGWKRFLVYSELTKSKKGTDYIAFFVYFAFQSAIRVILAEGPRQFVNGTTLYAVMQAKLINGPKDEGKSNVSQFFSNIETIADENYQQAIIYASMLFTLVIWVFSALCLLGAGILYIVFLWHYIPQRDGRLRIYCRRKIDRRLEKIVAERYGVGEQNEAKKKEKQERKAELKRQKTGELPPPTLGIKRAPTLPDIGEDAQLKKDDAVSLKRQDTKSTVSTLPTYSSRPSTRQDMEREPTLPHHTSDRPEMPSRTATMASARSKASFDSNAPLLPNAGFFGGDGRVPSPAPTYYSRNNSSTSVPYRINTQSTQASQRSLDTQSSAQRSYTPVSANGSRPPPGQRFPVRSNTAYSFDEPYSAHSEASPIDSFGRPPMPPPPRQNFAPPMRHDSDISSSSRYRSTPAPHMDRRPTFDSVNPSYRGPTPAPIQQPTHGRQNSFSRPFTPAHTRDLPTTGNSYEMTPTLPQQAPGNLYMPFNPHQHGPSNTPVIDGPRRNITVGGPESQRERGDYFSLPNRSFTSPIDARVDSSYGSILDDYGASSPRQSMDYQPTQGAYPPRGPSRSHTAGPDAGAWNGRF